MFREDLYRTQRIRNDASLPLSEKLTMHPKALRIIAFAHQLRGKNLACWCPLDQPCHADVLLGFANADIPNVTASPTGSEAEGQ